MDRRIDRSQIIVGNISTLEKDEKKYWAKADVKEKLQTITYLRECFYGHEATTGRLQRFYQVFKRI
jgi:hypothetical protein